MNSYVDVVLQCDLFSSLQVEEAEQLASSGIPRSLNRGEMLHTPLEQCSHVALVVSGSLELYRILASGDRVELRLAKPFDAIGAVACQSGSAYPAWVQAATHATVLEIPYEQILKCCTSRQFLVEYLRGIGKRMDGMLQRIECLSYRSLQKKLACYLLQQGNHNISVTAAADYLGSSREAVSRMLSDFTQQGYIQKEHRKISRIDSDALEALLFGL
ncbi:MAG: Crp/Fnr family transcriptional regulator [Spirochaetota bacterium]